MKLLILSGFIVALIFAAYFIWLISDEHQD